MRNILYSRKSTEPILLDLRRILLRSCNYEALGVRIALSSFYFGRNGRTEDENYVMGAAILCPL
jgi:hypothetical protein